MKKEKLILWPQIDEITKFAFYKLYLAVSESALSSVFIREKEKTHRPMYYVIRVMTGVEARYPLTEKLVFPLIEAARKLKPYFEANPVEIITDQPLR
ncbi:hypothetical protein LIER_33948 [Lithospermum erythrorhizon]|uniref:Reverse transcriptase RNase H-like domain-containing protein n=1 Tax=Lithospermum erythrorhizon TaxID=34254 RepID=A0AAV3S196_LITER